MFKWHGCVLKWCGGVFMGRGCALNECGGVIMGREGVYKGR